MPMHALRISRPSSPLRASHDLIRRPYFLAIGMVAASLLALTPPGVHAQTGVGRVTTGRVSSQRTGVGLSTRRPTGIANRLDGRSITASGWGLTSREMTRNTLGGLGWSPDGRYSTRSTFARGSAVEVIHCSGVTAVSATKIWGGGASLRDCGPDNRSNRDRGRSYGVIVPPYGYAWPGYYPGYYPVDPYPYTYSSTAYPTAQVWYAPGAEQPRAPSPRYTTFDFTRPSALVFLPSPFALPFPVYTAVGSNVIYVEHAPGAAPGTETGPPETACARVTVIGTNGDGWWKTVWLPALGAGSVDELRQTLTQQIVDGVVTVRDSRGGSFQVPRRADLRDLYVDRCPA